MNFRFAAFSVVLVTVVLAVDRLPGADGSLVGHWRLAGNGRDYSGNGNHAVNILNPIQPLAAGMNPFELKQEFGGTLCFDGGIDIQELLPKAPEQVVRNRVKKMIDIMGNGGGYILAGSHTIQADTPVENIVAIVEAVNSGNSVASKGLY